MQTRSSRYCTATGTIRRQEGILQGDIEGYQDSKTSEEHKKKKYVEPSGQIMFFPPVLEGLFRSGIRRGSLISAGGTTLYKHTGRPGKGADGTPY